MATETKPAAAKDPGAGSRAMLLGLVAINCVGVLAIGAYLALGNAHAAPAQEDAHAAAEGHEEPHELGPLIELESMVVNLADGEGGRYLKLTLQMELSSEDEVHHVEEHLVPVRDGVLAYLSSLGIAQVHGVEAMEAVRAHLLEIANERLGGHRVRRIYFTEYLCQ